MKILLVGGYGPSLLNFRSTLIRLLIDEGHEVVACAPELGEDVIDGLNRIGARHAEVKLNRSGLSPWGELKNFLAMRRLIRRERPEAIFLYTVKPVIWGLLAAARENVPIRVPMITGLGYAFTEGPGFKRALAGIAAICLYKLALVSASRIIFQNPDDRDVFKRLQLYKHEGQAAVVDGSGVDTKFFAEEPMPRGISFLMIARLLGDKGVREYATASAMVKARYPDTPIRLVGYLDDTPDCISQAELDDMIAGGLEYLGKMEDVRPAIAAASVYVLPSYREGTPRSVLEAMSMGRPVITTDVPGCRETVQDGVNGFLVPAKDPQALADAMMRLIEDQGLLAKMGKRSREVAEARYESNKVSRQIIAAAGLLDEASAP